MKNDKLVPGMILVIIGAIFLLYNFGYLDFHWENFATLWPLFIVMVGVNLLLAHNNSAWASILKISVVVGGFAIILFGNFDGHVRWWPHSSYSFNSDSDDDDDDSGNNHAKITNVSGKGEFNEPFKASVKIARINISGGAATYRLADTTNQLFKADTRDFKGRYEFLTRQEDSVYVMDFKMKNNHIGGWGNNNNSNSVYMSLNTRPEWEMTINAGATDLNFDLSKYKVRSVELNGGAGSFVLKTGEPLATTNIEISAGAADVTVNIPKDAACQIESDTGLSSNTFDGFTKGDDGHYETAGFDAAKNKLYIHISGAVSDFKVHKY